MRAFVTGATGFIGSHLLDELEKQGIASLIYSRQDMRHNNTALRHFIQGDLADILCFKEQIATFLPDAIIYMAWEGIPDYSYDMSKKNLMYGLNVLELCRIIGCKKIIITGSCWEYKSPSGLVAEDAPVSSENGFKAAKNSLRMMADSFCSQYEIALHWLRLFYVYGPGQKPASLIPSIMRSLKNGENPKLLTPYSELDYIYVKDVARCITHVLKNELANGMLNVGSGTMAKNIKILELIAKQMRFNFREEDYAQNASSKICFGADISKLTASGFKICYSLADGVKEIIDREGF